jgi:hypothetical protein
MQAPKPEQGLARAWFVFSSDSVTFARNCDPASIYGGSSNGSIHSSVAASSKHASETAAAPPTTTYIRQARSLSSSTASPRAAISHQTHADAGSGPALDSLGTQHAQGTPQKLLTTRRRLAQLVSALRMARLNVGWLQLFGAKQVAADEEGGVSSDVVQQIAKLKKLMTTFHVSARALLACVVTRSMAAHFAISP